MHRINKKPTWIVKSIVPEEVYTDRQEFLDYFYHKALEAAQRRTMSTVLLGQRRMGKTEIFKRVVNRLFFEQDPRNPNAVVPVYYSFPDAFKDERSFAEDYLENFMRYYVGFYTLQPELILQQPKGDKLLAMIARSRALFPFTERLDWILDWHDSIVKQGTYLPDKDAVEIPRRVSDVDDSTIVVFLDEFQNTRLPQYGLDIVGYMKEAVESPTCPHFVTGSAMSILAREIIGRGSLFGRFRSKPIEPMSGYWGTELALKAARYYQAEVPDIMAPIIADRCGGSPFYITAVVHQAADLHEALRDEETLNKVLAVDICSGFIWGELHDQVTRWIERMNEHGITKWILYLSALEEEERISIERIRKELKAREGKDVPIEMIRDVLVKLSRGDLVEYLELGEWFRKVDDPILLEFLKVWGKVEVEGKKRSYVQEELVHRYQKLERRIREYKGYLAEVFMSQVLLNGQKKTFPGHLFNSQEDVTMPWPFFYVHHRVRLRSGSGQEIDLLGSAGNEVWVCQSKWVIGEKIGVSVLQELLSQAEVVKVDKEPETIRMWVFAYKGLTKQAEQFAREYGILWSSYQDLNELLRYLGLRPLPELHGN